MKKHHVEHHHNHLHLCIPKRCYNDGDHDRSDASAIGAAVLLHKGKTRRGR